MLFLVLAGAAPAEGADVPQVDILSPADGSTCLERTVNVSGTASGTFASWFQSDEVDFTGGTLENVVVNPGGSVQLAGPDLFGNYTSTVFDSTSDAPVLTQVYWNANVPQAGNLSVRIRSGTRPDMLDAGGWSAVSNGQTAGFPLQKRYLQYLVMMSTTDISQRPSFLDIRISYRIDIMKVEVSVDDRVNWLLANGTGEWHLRVSLPFDTVVIYARATDTAGRSELDSIMVYVDDTAPVGSIALNGGAPFTGSRTVNLTAIATDNFAVTWILLGERPDFFGSSWQVFPPPLEYNLSVGDGPKTVYARFRNILGVESGTVNASIWLDTAPPTGTVVISGGEAYSRNGTVNLTFTAQDVAGVPEMKVGLDPALEGSAWQPFRPEMVFDLGPADGRKTVHASFRDSLGQVSATVNDTIFLDREPPAPGMLAINNGSAYTRQRSVLITFNATDNDAVASVQIGEGADNVSAPFRPYERNLTFLLSPEDGYKLLVARPRDAAGNIGPAAMADIFLDTTNPVAEVQKLPGVSNETAFLVRWNGTDRNGAVASYDIQYSRDGGDWLFWLINTSLTQARFSGEDGHRYTFRARAIDAAGNRGDFAWNISNAILVDLPGPVVRLTGPRGETVQSGWVTARGTALTTNTSRDITFVEVQLDSGEWYRASGTRNWSYTFDSTQLSDGWHILGARAFDGTKYSKPSSIEFQVDNAIPTSTSVAYLICAVLAVVMTAIGIGAVLSFIYKTSQRPEAPAAGTAYYPRPPGPAYPPRMQYAPGRPPPVTGGFQNYPPDSAPYYTIIEEEMAAEGQQPVKGGAVLPLLVVEQEGGPAIGAISGGLEIEEVTTPDAEVGGIPPPEVAQVEETAFTEAVETLGSGTGGPPGPPEAPALPPEAPPGPPDADRHGRILKALATMPRGLPLPLLGTTMNELAGMILSAPRRKAPNGTPLVRLKGSWYHADENNLKDFMVEYRP